ncbi:putative pterin-binding protein [Mesorhizobium sp. A556]
MRIERAHRTDRSWNGEPFQNPKDDGSTRWLPGFARYFRPILLVAALLGLPAGALAKDLPQPAGKVLLRITGDIERTNGDGEARFDRAMIEALALSTLETTTVVADGVKRFKGVLMRDLLDVVGAAGTVVTASALNDYVVDIPVTDFEEFDVLMAFQMDGEQLTRRDKGPYWIVYPRDDFTVLQDIRYDSRWVWQLHHLDVR